MTAEARLALETIFEEVERLAEAGFTGSVSVHFKNGEPSSIESRAHGGKGTNWRLPLHNDSI